jgi:hypothetical protein
MASKTHEPHHVKAELTKVIDENIDTEKLRAKFDISNFEPNAVLRGMQLTLVGAHRALQNPALFTSDHYCQAAIAVAVGIAIRLLVSLPVSSISFFPLRCRDKLMSSILRF